MECVAESTRLPFWAVCLGSDVSELLLRPAAASVLLTTAVRLLWQARLVTGREVVWLQRLAGRDPDDRVHPEVSLHSCQHVICKCKCKCK